MCGCGSMAGLLEELVTYLTEAGLVAGDGEDTFRDFMPSSPDNVVVLYEYSSDPINYYTDSKHRSVQVRVRNTSANEAKRLAKRIYDAFVPQNSVGRVDFTADTWGQVHLRQLPMKLEQDDRDRVHYVFNLGITTTNEE